MGFCLARGVAWEERPHPAATRQQSCQVSIFVILNSFQDPFFGTPGAWYSGEILTACAFLASSGLAA